MHERFTHRCRTSRTATPCRVNRQAWIYLPHTCPSNWQFAHSASPRLETSIWRALKDDEIKNWIQWVYNAVDAICFCDHLRALNVFMVWGLLKNTIPKIEPIRKPWPATWTPFSPISNIEFAIGAVSKLWSRGCVALSVFGSSFFKSLIFNNALWSKLSYEWLISVTPCKGNSHELVFDLTSWWSHSMSVPRIPPLHNGTFQLLFGHFDSNLLAYTGQQWVPSLTFHLCWSSFFCLSAQRPSLVRCIRLFSIPRRTPREILEEITAASKDCVGKQAELAKELVLMWLLLVY